MRNQHSHKTHKVHSSESKKVSVFFTLKNNTNTNTFPARGSNAQFRSPEDMRHIITWNLLYIYLTPLSTPFTPSKVHQDQATERIKVYTICLSSHPKDLRMSNLIFKTTQCELFRDEFSDCFLLSFHHCAEQTIRCEIVCARAARMCFPTLPGWDAECFPHLSAVNCVSKLRVEFVER